MKYFNNEGYADPTAYEALNRIQREEKKSKYRPMVYICSPFSSGDISKNIENARKYSRYAVDNHCIPVAPHLLFPQFMNEEKERSLAMFMNRVLLGKCDELWVFGSIYSSGMKKEMKWARQKKMAIKFVGII